MGNTGLSSLGGTMGLSSGMGVGVGGMGMSGLSGSGAAGFNNDSNQLAGNRLGSHSNINSSNMGGLAGMPGLNSMGVFVCVCVYNIYTLYVCIYCSNMAQYMYVYTHIAHTLLNICMQTLFLSLSLSLTHTHTHTHTHSLNLAACQGWACRAWG
jgi:hypothetical protein